MMMNIFCEDKNSTILWNTEHIYQHWIKKNVIYEPKILPICPTCEPTAPAAPVITIVSPSFGLQISFNPKYAVFLQTIKNIIFH